MSALGNITKLEACTKNETTFSCFKQNKKDISGLFVKFIP